MKDDTIVVTKDMILRLTTPEGEATRTFVYVQLMPDGKLEIAGGSSIIWGIRGPGMKEKVFNN